MSSIWWWVIQDRLNYIPSICGSIILTLSWRGVVYNYSHFIESSCSWKGNTDFSIYKYRFLEMYPNVLFNCLPLRFIDSYAIGQSCWKLECCYLKGSLDSEFIRPIFGIKSCWLQHMCIKILACIALLNTSQTLNGTIV